MKGRALWPQSCKLSQFPNFIHRAGSERQPTPRAEQQAEAATLTRPQGGNTGAGAYRVLGPEPRWKNNKRIRNTHVASCVNVASGIPNIYLQILHRYPRPAQRLPGHFTGISGLPNIYPHSLHHQYIQPTQSLPTLSTPLVYPAYPISTHTLYTTSIS